MNAQHFTAKMEEIYAVFGKNLPEKTKFMVIWRRVQDFPDAFMDFALAQIQDLEKLPANFGRFLVLELKPAFDGNRAIKGRRPDSLCGECHGDGYIHAYGQDKFPRAYPCICSYGNWTKDKIVAAGGFLTDPFLPANPTKRVPPTMRQAFSTMGQEFEERQDHAEYMASLESEDSF